MNKYRATANPCINQYQWKIQKQLEQKVDLKQFTQELCVLFQCKEEELEFRINSLIQIVKFHQLSRIAVIKFKLLIQQKLIENQLYGIHQSDINLIKDIIIFIELIYLQSEDEIFLPDQIPSSISPLRQIKNNTKKDKIKKAAH